jgi:hypothetical protein
MRFFLGFILGIIWGVYIMGCGVYQVPAFPEDLCSDYASEDSLILRTFEEHSIPIESAYYGILDAAAVAVALADPDEVEQVLDYLEYAMAAISVDGITYNGVVDEMLLGLDKKSRVGLLLARRLVLFRSLQPLSGYDLCLIETGLDHAYKELSMYGDRVWRYFEFEDKKPWVRR